jgi:hypothetical protein
MSAFKVMQLKTEATAHVVVRNRAGKKLLDIYLPGVSISLAVPSDAEIKVEPNLHRSQETNRRQR